MDDAYSIEIMDAESGRDVYDESEWVGVESEPQAVSEEHAGSDPQVGQEFKSLDEVYEFYNAYAMGRGFSIRKGSNYRARNDREVISKEYVCSKQGTKWVRSKEEGPHLKRRPIIRENCMARLVVKYKRWVGVWMVTHFTDEHSHPLINTPSKRTELRSHRRVHRTSECVDMVNTLHSSGLRAHQIPEVINNMHKDLNLDITPQEYYMLFRYTMAARYISHNEEQVNCNGVTPMMGWCIRAKAMKLVNASLRDIDRFNKLDVALNTVCEDFEAMNVVGTMQIVEMESEIDSTRNLSDIIGSIPEVSIRDPHIAKHKGRPRNLERITSGMEKSKKDSMKRKCGICGERGHYATTCKKKVVEE